MQLIKLSLQLLGLRVTLEVAQSGIRGFEEQQTQNKKINRFIFKVSMDEL